MPERTWYPVSKPEFFLDSTRRRVVDVREHLETLVAACTEPYVLTDSGVARITRVRAEQAGNLTLCAEHARAWGWRTDLSPSRRAKLTTLEERLATLWELNVFAVAGELASGTLKTVMAASDEEPAVRFGART